MIELLSCGWCRHPACIVMRGCGPSLLRLPAGVALIRHPRLGLGLFDTGYSQRFLAATNPWPERFYRWITPPECPSKSSAASQLAARGIAPSEVRWILLSHLHADHVAGILDFPNASILLHADALSGMRRRGRWSNLLHGVLPALLPDDLDRRTHVIRSSEFVLNGPGGLPGVDLAGDGSLLAIPLLGHAAGQLGLLISPPDAGPTFLVADAAWTTQAIIENCSPADPVDLIVEDPRQTRLTLGLLHRLHHERPDIRLVPSHCPRAFAG